MGARLGQHFLFDPGILGRIADAAVASGDEQVLEIGAGKGTLTRELARRAQHVSSIETDRRLLPGLEAEFAGSNVRIIPGDALEVEWPAADVVTGNIPYQITSPLIERALTPPRPRRVVFLVQKEVADRVAAKPGSDHYGALSAGVQLVADVERLFTVKAGAFQPPPKVDSAVVRIVPRADALSRDEEAATRRLIALLFQRRRQQIQRSIREVLADSQQPIANSQQPSAISQILTEAGFEPTARAETLAPSQFAELARLFPPA